MPDLKEVPSAAVAAAVLRHEAADGDDATPQEKKQAAAELAHVDDTRPQGSFAQLHDTDEPTVAVADDATVKALKAEVAEAAAEPDAKEKKAAASDDAKVATDKFHAAGKASNK
jgi:hypothetical protein